MFVVAAMIHQSPLRRVWDGAPLRMAVQTTSNKHMCRPSLFYANDQVVADIQRNGKLTQH